MRSMGWIGFAALALLASCNLLKRADGDAGATTATAGLPAECETFLTRYSCFLNKEGKPTTEADDMRREWTTSAANPALRPTIADVCKKQLATQGAAFDKAGCTSGTAVAAATTSNAPPVAKAATTSVPAAPKANACKANGDCAKNQRCLKWVDGNICASICGAPTDVCPSGEVCEASAYLADGSGIIGFCAKAPHNVAFGGACKSTLDCVAGEKCIKASDGTMCRHYCKSGKCPAPNEECGPEGIEPPMTNSEPKDFCVPKKGGAAAPTASASSGGAPTPTGQFCSDIPEDNKTCPKGFHCQRSSLHFGACVKD